MTSHRDMCFTLKPGNTLFGTCSNLVSTACAFLGCFLEAQPNQPKHLSFLTTRPRRTECVRLKNFVVEAQIMGNTIKYCGVYDFAFGNGGKNGEGIYIGTSSTQVSKMFDVPMPSCNNFVCDVQTLAKEVIASYQQSPIGVQNSHFSTHVRGSLSPRKRSWLQKQSCVRPTKHFCALHLAQGRRYFLYRLTDSLTRAEPNRPGTLCPKSGTLTVGPIKYVLRRLQLMSNLYGQGMPGH